MKKLYFLFFGSLILALQSFSQMFILNEDFSGASGTTPPNGWIIEVISGATDDTWHFDNPGERVLNYPVTDPFAIFDSEFTSANGSPEEVALQTPVFDASTSNFILLYFDQTFDPGTGGLARIEAHDGDAWHEVATYTSSTSNPAAEIVDLSAICGGITNGQLRFIWSGNGSGYWALDNISIYASLPLDGGVVSLDNPDSPVAPGVHDIEITLGNFGYNTISSTTVEWTADGIPQTPFNFNGSIGFGQTQSGVVIGNYNFQEPVLLKIWQTDPNGQTDQNPFNDTITKLLSVPLCGTYTIGGNDPDFETFSEVANVLNAAGITCPVTFLVRDGTYYEQFILRDIPGTSASNTVTFRSESGDSTQAILQIIPQALKYEPMILLEGTKYISFEHLGLFTGSVASFANSAISMEGADHITISNCYFESWKQFDFSVEIFAGSNNIEFIQNRIECLSQRSGAIQIYDGGTQQISILNNTINGAVDWGFKTIEITDHASFIELSGNLIEECYQGIYLKESESINILENQINNSNNGVVVSELCSSINISKNRLSNIKSHTNEPDGTKGIFVNTSSEIAVTNNFIHTHGDGPVHGIFLENVSQNQIIYNSINITNNDKLGKSNGIAISESDNIIGRNNIFNIKQGGTPIYIDQAVSSIDFDYNDYYSYNKLIGYFNGTFYYDLAVWANELGMDNHSISIIPFYTSDTNLSINQILLNDVGIPVVGIPQDIDGNLRGANPDIGAKEYDLCPIDAGINQIASPENPLSGGNEQVRVTLQNQGQNNLSAVEIQWQVNEIAQVPFQWSGNLSSSASEVVEIGSYNFQSGTVYTLKIWTVEPNNTTDCNNHNDTILSGELAVPLCGTYTLGGAGADFTSFYQASTVLNIAGISCPVSILVRDGIYFEQFVLGIIPGASEVNTITFRSESGDSTQAIVQIDPDALKSESMIYLEGSENIIFQSLGLHTGSEASDANHAISMSAAKNIRLENCHVEVLNQYDIGVFVNQGSSNISFLNNRFKSDNYRAGAMKISGETTRDIYIQNNHINGSTDWTYKTINIEDGASKIELSDNLIEQCHIPIYLVSTDSSTISNNIIKDSDYGITISDFCSQVDISANRLINIRNDQNIQDETTAITVKYASGINIYNNYIHTAGGGPVIGIYIKQSEMGEVVFNSINSTNETSQLASKGLLLERATEYTVQNNIFSMQQAGIPVILEENNIQLQLDYNDYYSFDGSIGVYNGRLYSNLEAWSDSVGTDQNSLAVKPFYISDTDLAMNQILLNNAGIPVSGINDDIDGTSRNPSNPDLGAKEYDPCSNDAGINAFISPQSPFPGGFETVEVLLQNQGTAALTSVNINWSVNDENQTAFEWTGNLASGSNQEVNIGNYDFQAGILYRLKVWTSLPNNTNDCNHYNDTILSPELSGPLCGTYTIGGDNPDFISFVEVAEVLNSAGITCPVVFNVRNGIYYEQIELGIIPGSSEENTITFQSEAGDSTQAIIQIKPEALFNEPMIHLNASENILFKNLGLFTGSTNGEANNAIHIESASNIVVENCLIETHNEFDFGIEIIGGSENISVYQNKIENIHPRSGALKISGNQTRNISITKNYILGGEGKQYSIFQIENFANNIIISENHIERCNRAIYMIQVDSITITDNLIQDTYGGIHIERLCSEIDISANRIIETYSTQNSPDGTNGVFINISSGINLINNFIHTAGDRPVKGITLNQVDSAYIHYNSINITNNDPQLKSKGLLITESSQISGRNNIMQIKYDGTPIEFNMLTEFPSLDYNNYYHPGGKIGTIDGQDFDNLFEWGQTINGDANSKTVNSYFKTDTNPLPFQRALNGAGIPIPGILYDIDGKLRYEQAPDIGCVEFFVDYGIGDLLSPTLDCFHPTEDSVTVLITQFGDVPFDELIVAYQMDGGPVQIDTVPGPVLFDVIHTFDDLVDITAEGDYFFKIWLIGTFDDNINNDTLETWRYSKPSPVVTFEYDNFCTGPEVYFFGQAEVVEPYTIASYEWLFGDGETAVGQDVVHTYQEPGTYEVTLRAYSDAGCYGYVTQSVYIDPEFEPLNLDYSIVHETCLNDGTGVLEILAAGGYPPYNIYLNGALLSETTITNFSMGQYVIEVIDSENCTVTDTVETAPEVYMNPQIIADPLTGNTPLTVDFDFTADNAVSWAWIFDDNSIDTSKMTSHTFYEFGEHLVILEVSSGPPHNCTETDSVIIFVDIHVNIEANNVFTPNGDSINDYFEVITTGIRDLNVKIYSRWGNKVFEIEEVNGKWDGNTKGGAHLPDGTYFYALNALGYNDQTYEQQGSVLLLRHASQAFPNPVDDVVNVKTHGPLDAPVDITVYSIFGQLVHSESVNDPDNININLSSLRSGIYIISINDSDHNYYVRIVKN